MLKILLSLVLFVVLVIFTPQTMAQSRNVFPAFNWLATPLKNNQATLKLTSKASLDSIFNININMLEQALKGKKAIVISVPLPDGRLVDFNLTSSPVMAKVLAEKYPSIRTFSGYQVDKPQHRGRFDITPHGFHGIFTYHGDKVFVDPVFRGDNHYYHSYFRRNALPLNASAFVRKLPPRRHLFKTPWQPQQPVEKARLSTHNNVANELLTYRIAIATTGEYSTFHGGTKEKALAAVVTMLNRINDVYQQDLAIKLKLVAQNDAIIFTDPSSDPFDNTDNDIDVITDVINNAIGVDNYDIGHLVSTGGGGVAGLGVVCTAYKAEGETGSNVPTNDAFYIDFVAHELGHQFSAEHTFNGISGACDGNRSSLSAYEVGSGSTIMGYAGLCEQQNLQNNSDPYFHIYSIDQINTYTRVNQGSSCGTKTSKANQAPTVDAGNDYFIPARTPFILTGQASDNENDNLTYSWEQFDLGTESANKVEAQTDDGSRPLFRVFQPQTTATRTFPILTDVINNQVSFGESLPTTSRELNFRLVVRDDQGNLADDATKITVVGNDDGFAVIEPSASAVFNGGQQTVTWNTAATELSPILCTKVDISLSVDSGNNFAVTLLSATDNDGSQLINLPNLTTSLGRIKIACSDNIFFAMSTTDISITSDGSTWDSKPEFIAQQALLVDEDQSITLSASDFTFVNNLQIDRLNITAADNYQINGLTVIPNNNFNGQLRVDVTASKGEFTSDVFSTLITVKPINDAPVAVNDSATVAQDTGSNIIDVLNNDSDIDGDQLSIAAIDYTGAGSVTISNDQLIYSPATGFNGSDSLTYTIDDNNQGVASATLIITVTASPIVDKGTSSKSSGGTVWFLLVFWPMLLVRNKSKEA